MRLGYVRIGDFRHINRRIMAIEVLCDYLLRFSEAGASNRRTVQCESKKSPLKFSDIFPKRLGIFSPNVTYLLYVSIYAGLQIFIFNYLQLWRSYAILSPTTIMCSKCPPLTEMHAGWSRLTLNGTRGVQQTPVHLCVAVTTVPQTSDLLPSMTLSVHLFVIHMWYQVADVEFFTWNF